MIQNRFITWRAFPWQGHLFLLEGWLESTSRSASLQEVVPEHTVPRLHHSRICDCLFSGLTSCYIFSFWLIAGSSKCPPRLCDLCMAEKPTKRANPAMNFKNMATDAPYRLTNINHATYLATTSQVSPWSAIPGWELECNVFDVMHNLFLGSGRDFLGSAIRLLLEHGAFDAYGVQRSSHDMFARITLEIHDTYKQHGFLWPSIMSLSNLGMPYVYRLIPLNQ